MSTRITLTELRAIGEIGKQGGRVPEHYFEVFLSAMHYSNPATWHPNEPPDKTVRRVFLSGHQWQRRGAAVDHVKRKDLYLATCGHLYTDVGFCMNDNKTYRVSIFPDGVDVLCFGLESVDSALEGHYDSVDALPDWVKERLALLNMIPLKPPTSVVEGIGRRISSHVYWVFASE